MKLPFFSTNVPQVSPKELSELIAGPKPPSILDVREASELLVSSLEGAVNIPIHQVAGRLAELDPELEWVVICRSGSRSQHAAEYLLQNGFTRVKNLSSGLNGWSRDVDPTMRRY